MAKRPRPFFVPTAEQEATYLNLLLDPLEACVTYKPKFGTDEEDGVDLDQFKIMYGQDPLYHWIGLDSDLMYAAHKAAGCMTSIYRQLGNGCECLFRAVVRDALWISEEQVQWAYEAKKDDGTTKTLTLDARIDLEHIQQRPEVREKMADWLKRCGEFLALPKEHTDKLRGAIFEVRQGYKKR